METLLNRYRSLTVLLVMIVAQLLLLAYQVRSDQDVRLIRVWAVTLVTPLARTIETTRSSVVGFLGNYISLRDIRGEYKQNKEELGRLKLENQFLRAELATADRARALVAFQARSQARTVAARVIFGAGSGSNVRFADRGSTSGVEKGMAVVTPDGIVGKVTAVFPLTAQILLISDPNFGAGVISQKGRARGTLHGQGYGTCKVDHIGNEVKVEPGEWFYTSGDDRVFPKGMPAGRVRSVKDGAMFKDIVLEPSGLLNGIEEVLIVLESVHQPLPEQTGASTRIYLSPPPPPDQTEAAPAAPASAGTDADRLRERYRATGEAQGHVFGEGGPGAKPPDFSTVHTRTVVAPARAAPQTAPASRPPQP